MMSWFRRPAEEAKSLADGGIHPNIENVRAAHDALNAIEPLLVSRLRDIYLRAQRLLVWTARNACCRSIEDDLLAAHKLIDLLAANGTRHQISELLGARVRVAGNYVAEHAETRALRSYNRGLARATFYSVAVLVASWLVLQLIFLGHPPAAMSQILVAIGGGAVGAMVSVLVRQVKGIADIDDAALATAAIRRVVLGWIFAAALVFLLKGGIITIVKPPADGADGGITELFFWGGLGFLAGFNERWVRQLISRTPDSEDPAKPKPQHHPERPPKKRDKAPNGEVITPEPAAAVLN